jgi:hypothetical protein
MKRENFDQIINLISTAEKSNEEINLLISNLTIPTRNELLKEITSQIIRRNPFLNDVKILNELSTAIEPEVTEPDSIESLLDNLILNIQNNPFKKVIFLKLFLDRFHEISEQDKNVIIQSVKDESIEDIKEKLISLVRVFKLDL